MNLPSAISYGAFAKLILLDLTLGVNNAVLIVPTCLSIPAALRRRAVMLGTVGAIVLRALMLVLASFLVGMPGVNLVAGLYLLYSGYRMLVAHDTAVTSVKPHLSLYTAAAAVAIADLMMSVDNILVLAAATHGLAENGTGYAIAAVCFSIPVILFGSEQLAKVIHRLPALVWCGGALLGFIGCALAISDPLIVRYASWAATNQLGASLLPLLSAALVVTQAVRARRRALRVYSMP
ncbi:hypothetical protein WJ97_13620 [Burkholderia ubonensis]|uniref:TerC family protein n=1 Tax=Burkholderia ubonensis TaxID=101571 RepID=UPI000754A2E1|nr:hypothetical protein [Burkholderia ubonensis]KVP96870.1 hypothetical protein WJ97_13620 [Burkholderia ubonensis]